MGGGNITLSLKKVLTSDHSGDIIQKLLEAARLLIYKMGNTHPQEFVLIAMWVHLFPSRTQKLSTSAPTILGGRLPGKIGNANTKPPQKCGGSFFIQNGSAP